jgi:hypothetical protein
MTITYFSPEIRRGASFYPFCEKNSKNNEE